MAKAYSPVLRSRVIKAAAGGLSARQAAARFGVGVLEQPGRGSGQVRLDMERAAGGDLPADGVQDAGRE